jgi:hypothetical protein
MEMKRRANYAILSGGGMAGVTAAVRALAFHLLPSLSTFGLLW